MDICAAFYHRVNDDVCETFLNSFRKVNDKALLQVHTDDVPVEIQTEWSENYGVEWIITEPAQGQRCYQRMMSAVETSCDRLVFCDVDVYFLDDPFKVFDKRKFDLGLTKRIHSYKFPVNSGVFFVRPEGRDFLSEFPAYADEHKDIWDWFIDQDFLNYLWGRRGVVDVGWEWNFCPNTDVFGTVLAMDMIRRAYESKSVKILHLKSELKNLIYDGFLEYAINRPENKKAGWDWQHS